MKTSAGSLAWVVRNNTRNSVKPNWIGDFLIRLCFCAWFTINLTGSQAAAPAEKKPAKETPETTTVREPAVAGLFYPANKTELFSTVDRLLASAEKVALTNVRALVCPHAGYPYSGPIAAKAYKCIQGRNYRTVFVLAPSHYAAFSGIAVTKADSYRTSLGTIPISSLAPKLAAQRPFVPESVCQVQRPAWYRQSSRSAPPAGEDTPETWEHSLEVQLPFLQRALTNFALVPALFGEADPSQAARVLSGLLDETTLVIASSDLSHYHPYNEAKMLDQQCVKDICDLNVEGLRNREACGKAPILAVMQLARQKGWKTQLLDYRNSGDTGTDRQGVVGYAAIAFYEAGPQSTSIDPKNELLQLARQTIRDWVTKKSKPTPDARRFPASWSEPKGCFVTLTKQGQLRGCIGHIVPQEPLLQAVVDNACSAATEDPRFTPLREAELNQIEIEISLLTNPQPLAFSSPEDLLAKLRPHVDGVVLKIGGRGATYLPQVWEQLPDKVEFLNHLSEKAGCASDAWRQSGAQVLVYQVESFKEDGGKIR
jgi:MEMO1 family protein